MKRIEWGRRDVTIKDAMVMTLVDDEHPEKPPALVVAFDRPSRALVDALAVIRERMRDSIAVGMTFGREPEDDQ